jgi:hypothetical protein
MNTDIILDELFSISNDIRIHLEKKSYFFLRILTSATNSSGLTQTCK